MSLLPDFDFERSLLPSGCRYLLGIDEVGRGPLAGPVTIGAFVLDLKIFNPDEFIKLKVTDSKKLTANKRRQIATYFSQSRFSFTTFSATNTDIDRQGITTCLSGLFQQALSHYRGLFDFVLIDGVPIGKCRSNKFSARSHVNEVPTREHGKISLQDEYAKFIVKGDARCFSIAAASIIAKVTRDAVMDEFDKVFPVYGFSAHKGYGTKKHLTALTTHGPCKIHRLSYQPVATLIHH